MSGSIEEESITLEVHDSDGIDQLKPALSRNRLTPTPRLEAQWFPKHLILHTAYLFRSYLIVSEQSVGLGVINMLNTLYVLRSQLSPGCLFQTVYQSRRGPSDRQRTEEVFRVPAFRRAQQPRNVKQTQPAVK